MGSPLYELKKEDWNRLFPIHLEEHNPAWKEIFQREKELVLSRISAFSPERIEHVGSTSIPGIKAKPYIDLLIVIPAEHLFSEELIAALAEIGFTYFLVPKRDDIEAYMSFGKGYNLDGVKEQIFHIHMCPGDNFMVNQIAYRDRLRSDETLAKAYEKLKIESAAKFKNDRGNYLLSKNEFIRDVLKNTKTPPDRISS
ncbi:GrpB family protein [Algoriphagus sp. H41]|uniref:GrpB family protein n=1 Tax=Algoriphagus oliviformis TaxID=2811231 RepID=A0ABS3C1X4_9BACT|nr:GrpB family protein [Algoriphagus oliviformis]MBN7810948.1 GrpB family protein [Algoriphagus oliviformis]